MIDWALRRWSHTQLDVGPCAWRLSMLAGPDRDYVNAHRSLIVTDPDDADDVLTAAVLGLGDMPLLLGIAEPAFARQLEDHVMRRLALLGRTHAQALVLHVDDPAEIKSGGMLQTLFALRDRGVIDCIGLAHPDANVVEWMSQNTAVRVMGVCYSLQDQSARHRAVPTADGYGMAAFSLSCPQDDQAMRFALAQGHSVLPVLDRPIPRGLTPMSPEDIDASWSDFVQAHPPPPALQRGRPPIPDR